MKLHRLLLLLLAGTLIGGVFYTYLFYSETGRTPGYSESSQLLLYTLATFIVVSAAVSVLRLRLNTWFPWQQMITVRLLVGMLLHMLLSLLIIGLSASLYMYITAANQQAGIFLEMYRDGAIKVGILVFVGVFVYTIIDFTLFSYKQFAQQQLASVRLTQTQLSLQLQILRNQLSPHFLFNSMNTISALVYQNRSTAEQFIRKLAHTYQYILSTHTKPLVTLSEETQFLHAYIFMLKARFEGAMDIQINLPDHVMQSKIPPLTLQLLVENAVKHNQATKENPLQIKIYVDMYDQITVKNTIHPKETRTDSFKIGLDNIRGRYQYLTNRQIQVLQDSHFTVKLPPIEPVHEAIIHS